MLLRCFRIRTTIKGSLSAPFSTSPVCNTRYKQKHASLPWRPLKQQQAPITPAKHIPSSLRDGGNQLTGPRAATATFRQGHLKDRSGHATPQAPSAQQFDSLSRGRIARFKRLVGKPPHRLYYNLHRGLLWSAYISLHSEGVKLLSELNARDWDVLWRSQASFRHTEPIPLENLELITHDMNTLGHDTQLLQIILHLERKVADGRIDEAVRNWIRGPASHDDTGRDLGNGKLKGHSDTQSLAPLSKPQIQQQLGLIHDNKLWLELGARIFAKARSYRLLLPILFELNSRLDGLDPRVAMLAIPQLSQGSMPEQLEAWSLFNRIFRTYQSIVRYADLELVFSGFLGNQTVAQAKAVFLLMAKYHSDSLLGNLERCTELLDRLFQSCKDLAAIDDIALDILTQNTHSGLQDVLFEVWLKHSIKGDPNHTAMIVEYMFELGKAPPARLVDRLIEAWTTSSADEDQVQKAEAIALSMVQKRMNSATRTRSKPDRRLPKYLRREVPAADARTYYHLAKHYAARGDSASAQQVLRWLMHTPNIQFHGHIVRAIVSIHFQLDDAPGAWDFFRKFSNDFTYQFDMETYAVLWKGLHLNLLKNKKNSMAGFPGPRVLFRHMLYRLTENNRDNVKLPLSVAPSRTMYERIIHCFGMAEDSFGLVLVLHSMKHLFGMEPTANTMVAVIDHVAFRVTGEELVKGHRTSESIQDVAYADEAKKRMARMAKRVQTIWQNVRTKSEMIASTRKTRKRVSTTSTQTVGQEQKQPASNDDDLLLVLSIFLHDYIQRNTRLFRRKHQAFYKARNEMGLEGIPEISSKLTSLDSLRR
ncbi:hypothetical protein BT63DRAFT_36106 [Microthyrium microscopicum]|uniref:Pentatricopeptide repeat protein n=1 Tax=Microthyrium microscopicum TaxID=703497 RepID=A0A6A6UVE8_9PEZI|nr:hypothetical protein BT63DRAFT_36106 [Microthyrium microscopicum]